MVSTVYWLNALVLWATVLPAAFLTLARFRVSRWLVVRARLAVGVKVAVQVLPSVPTGVRSPSVPLARDRPMASFVKPVTRSLTVMVIAALSPAVRGSSLVGAGAHGGVVPRAPDAGEVHADGVVGALGAGPGRVGGGPDLAVGADRRQGAQRALAVVVLDVLGTKAGDLLAEGEGDGHRLAGQQAGVRQRDGDLGRRNDVVGGRQDARPKGGIPVLL